MQMYFSIRQKNPKPQASSSVTACRDSSLNCLIRNCCWTVSTKLIWKVCTSWLLFTDDGETKLWPYHFARNLFPLIKTKWGNVHCTSAWLWSTALLHVHLSGSLLRNKLHTLSLISFNYISVTHIPCYSDFISQVLLTVDYLFKLFSVWQLKVQL